MKKEKEKTKGLYIPQLEKDSCGVGLIADLKSTPTHYIVTSALTMLENMEHRGACGAEENTGDGAGILTQIPFKFFSHINNDDSLNMPAPYSYGVGMFFFHKDPIKRAFCDEIINRVCAENNFEIFCTRKVPVDNSMIGESAKATEPDMVQLFFKPIILTPFFDLEKNLYFLKTAIMRAIYFTDESFTDDFYIASLSSKTLVYKGQLMATQLRSYFKDLQDENFVSAMAIIHSRFSTNTIPKWKLAQPFRCIAHNGEINTIQGNINWWQAREKYMEKSDNYKDNWVNAFPVCDPYSSDSGNFDNVVDFLIRTTRSIPHAMMMMIPEAWQNNKKMPKYKRGFYEYHDAILEPWDGPAAICFTDGNLVGATLDRNGLRPARYLVTTDGLLVVASEAGCLKIDQSKIVKKGRLKPGKMLLADLGENRILSDKEIKEVICKRFPYHKWLNNFSKKIEDFHFVEKYFKPNPVDLHRRQVAFGMTLEDEKLLLEVMATTGKEAISSMGADIPLAVLSTFTQHIANYFKQQFAQVTNPPIDSLREKYFMSLSTTLGGTSRILKIDETEANTLRIPSPLLLKEEFIGLSSLKSRSYQAYVVDATYTVEESMESAIDRIVVEIQESIVSGNNLICISNTGISKDKLPIPSLLAIGAIHQFLIASGDRKQASLLLEAGDAWETQHFATLLSFGADAICPTLTYETITKIALENDANEKRYIKEYCKAVDKGLLKIMSKLGVSTLASYKGAQTFEAVGISSEVIQKCFKGTVSRLEGMRFADLQKENDAKHKFAFAKKDSTRLPDAAIFQWKQNGEYHLFNPKTIHLLQHSTKLNDFDLFKKYTQEIDKAENNASTLRSFFSIDDTQKSIPLDEVEPIESILKRFVTGAMSFGSISEEAHTTLAIAMNRIGGKSNSGEGGEDDNRFKKLANGDWKRSAIKQVASGRFGVTMNYLTNADELQIKMAQGAKPGEGGQLPGHKVDENIARVRNATPGVGLISPPPHHDIYSIEDLAQLIFDLKNANRKARISVKLVSKTGVGVIASGVAKAHADHILISGHDGGTGASPLSSIRHAGLPWEMGLSETHQTLVKNKLRDRVILQCDGQIRTGRDMAIATMLGAEEWGIATAALVVEGCILMRKCHLNTCPVGIATQDKSLREKFNGKVEHLVNFFQMLAEDLRQIMASLGVKTVNELVGRADLLKIDKSNRHWKTNNLDLSAIIYPAIPEKGHDAYNTKVQDHKLDEVLDQKLIEISNPALENGERCNSTLNIQSTDRAVGTMLSNELVKRYGANGLPDDRIQYTFNGSAGQSFGAFLAKGISFNLIGEGNDYVGKGLSGGKLVLMPNKDVIFKPSKNVIAGNVCLYGATSGEAYFSGKAGDRFAVRNSGVRAVVEGIGDNGCEYMTGGIVLIIGDYGENFAAGMSGGIAYLYQPNEDKTSRINRTMVNIEKPDKQNLEEIKKMLNNHFKYTYSIEALDILNEWYTSSKCFIKIIPTEYKAILEKKKKIALTKH